LGIVVQIVAATLALSQRERENNACGALRIEPDKEKRVTLTLEIEGGGRACPGPDPGVRVQAFTAPK